MSNQEDCIKRAKTVLRIAESYDVYIDKNAKILDFGCGAGHTVLGLRSLGYEEAIGFDVEPSAAKDKMSREREPTNIVCLPYPNDYFDFIYSEQVFEHVHDQAKWWSEIARVLKPNGRAIHTFPARWKLLESHMFVPLAGAIQLSQWFKLWALLGVRNQYQRGMGWRDVYAKNVLYSATKLRYLPNSALEAIWNNVGLEWFWQNQLNRNHNNVFLRNPMINRLFFAIYRTAVSCRVIQKKKEK